MAIALRGSPFAVSQTGRSATLTKPTGVVDGDLLLISITGYGAGSANVDAPQTPTGFTQIGSTATATGSSNIVKTGWYYRVAASEGANYSVSVSNAGGDNFISCEVIAYSGVDQTTPFNLTGVSGSGNSSSPATTDLGSTTRDGCWHLLVFGTYETASTTPSGFTQDDAVGNDCFHKLISTAGATGSKSITNSPSSGWTAWACAIQPPAAAAVTGSVVAPGFHPGRGPTAARFFQSPLSTVVSAQTQNLQQALSGGLSFTGSGPTNAVAKGISGGLSFTGSGPRYAVGKVISGGLSFTGSRAVAVVKLLSGGASFTGSVARATSRSLSSGLSFTGSVARQTGRALSGTLSFAGSMGGRSIGKAVSGTLSFTGSQARAVAKLLSAGASFSGSMTRACQHGLSASLSFTGSTSRAASKLLASAALSFSGAILAGTAYFRSLSGSLSFTGSLTSGRALSKALTATLSFTGQQSRAVGHAMAAGLSFTGSSSRSVAKGLQASLGFSGSIGRAIRRGLSAGLGFLGSLVSGRATGPGTVQIFVSAAYAVSATVADARSTEVFATAAYPVIAVVEEVSE